MTDFGVRDVERMLQMPRSAVLALVHAGFVTPARGPRREFRFSFQDLIVLRAARALRAAKVPPRRITRSLRKLRDGLPATVPLSGLRISAIGDEVVVSEGRSRWRAESGQYLLDLDVELADDGFRVLERVPAKPQPAPDALFRQALEAEAASSNRARAAYEQVLALDPAHAAARVNLGRLLHEAGELAGAERVYRDGLRLAPRDATLRFNLGVLLDDAGRRDEAIAAYADALAIDPRFADCHYNLALAFEAAGNQRGAIRHMAAYRRLEGRRR